MKLGSQTDKLKKTEWKGRQVYVQNGRKAGKPTDPHTWLVQSEGWVTKYWLGSLWMVEQEKGREAKEMYRMDRRQERGLSGKSSTCSGSSFGCKLNI